MNISLANASSMSFIPAPRQPESQASAPGLAAKLFNLFAEKVAATAPHVRQGVILLIDGHPLLISISKEGEAVASLQKTLTLSMKEQLNEIKIYLGITVTQMSELFKVTRKTVYDWFDGADPRSNFAARISALYQLVISKAEKIDLKNLKKVWNLPVNGGTFIDVVNAPADQRQLENALSEKLDELAPRMILTSPRPKAVDQTPSYSVFGGIIRDADSR